jgi:hypothetical protein
VPHNRRSRKLRSEGVSARHLVRLGQTTETYPVLSLASVPPGLSDTFSTLGSEDVQKIVVRTKLNEQRRPRLGTFRPVSDEPGKPRLRDQHLLRSAATTPIAAVEGRDESALIVQELSAYSYGSRPCWPRARSGSLSRPTPPAGLAVRRQYLGVVEGPVETPPLPGEDGSQQLLTSVDRCVGGQECSPPSSTHAQREHYIHPRRRRT